MPRTTNIDQSPRGPIALLLSDREGDDGPVLSLESLLGRTGLLQAAWPQRSRSRAGETPIFGEGAVARWVELHDRARDLRAALPPGDGVGEQQARRAIRSLFLYEHVITPKTRWQARTRLWERDRSASLPPFVEQVRWAQCRCPRCQATVHQPRPVAGRSRCTRRSA